MGEWGYTRQQNMVILVSPAGLGTKKVCVGEGQKQPTESTSLQILMG
jgi:hypothetical protein